MNVEASTDLVHSKVTTCSQDNSDVGSPEMEDLVVVVEWGGSSFWDTDAPS